MSYRLVVRPEVDADLIEAEAWYEQQEVGLGREFLRDARETIDSLSTTHLFTKFVLLTNRCVGFTHTGFPTASSSG